MLLPQHPYLTIWLHPRATARRAIDSGRRRDIVLLPLIWGLSGALTFSAAPPETIPPTMEPMIAGFSIVVGTLLGAGVIYMNAVLRAWAARKVGACVTTGEVAEVMALAEIPFIFWFVLGAIMIQFIHPDMVKTARQPAPLWADLFLVMGGSMLLWSKVLKRKCLFQIDGLSKEQRQRAWRLQTRRYVLILASIAASIIFISRTLDVMIRFFRR